MEEMLEQAGLPISDRFAPMREISRSEHSVVYLARDPHAARPVALKLFSRAGQHTPEATRVLADARRLAGLRHPHLVPVLEAGSVGGTPYVVSAYVEGETLRRRLDRERQLPLRDAALLTAQVADALSHLHAHGVTHGAVRPGHVLLSGGRALLFDTAGTGDPGSGTDMRPGCGTDPAHGPNRDLMGLGALLYEAISGHPPRESEAESASEIPPVPLSLLRPATPGTLEAIVCESMDAESEPLTAEQLRDRLRWVADSLVALRPSNYLEQRGPFDDPPGLQIRVEVVWICLVLLTLGLVGGLLLL